MKKLNLNLLRKNRNAFALLGYFRKEAKKNGWSAEEIKKIQDKATSGDYQHLLATLMDL